jgi:hypothetical protein
MLRELAEDSKSLSSDMKNHCSDLALVCCEFASVGCLAYNFSVICPANETGQDGDRIPQARPGQLSGEYTAQGRFFAPVDAALRL